ncbi:hypothetical protein BH11BAC3_BH11BAC3_04920 [soil metagenome]
MKNHKVTLPRIWLCIILDLIGMSSFFFPLLGEFSDLIWAPLSALIFNYLFGGKLGKIGGVLSFLEEILPFTDIIPSFTIGWLIRRYEFEKMRKMTFSNFNPFMTPLKRSHS